MVMRSQGRGRLGGYKSVLPLVVAAVVILTAFASLPRESRQSGVTARASLNPEGDLKSKDILVGESVAFYGSSSAGVTPLQYSWYFRDRQTTGIANPSHAYSQPGSYEVALVVQDATGW